MASKHREEKIISTTACPECGAAIGQLCRLDRYTPSRHGPRAILHTARRLEWERAKRIEEAR